MLMAETERGGGFIEQEVLSKLAIASKFGEVADIRLVSDVPALIWELGNYLAKASVPIHEEAAEIGTYVAKINRNEALRARAGTRLRPLRVSRKWYPGGLTKAEQELKALIGVADPGPWQMVWHNEADKERENSAAR